MKPFLSDPPPPPAPAPKPKTITDRVRDYLLEQHAIDPAAWHKLADIATATELSTSQANGAIYALIGIRAVEPKLPSSAGRRRKGQVYRWRSEQ